MKIKIRILRIQIVSCFHSHFHRFMWRNCAHEMKRECPHLEWSALFLDEQASQWAQFFPKIHFEPPFFLPFEDHSHSLAPCRGRPRWRVAAPTGRPAGPRSPAARARAWVPATKRWLKINKAWALGTTRESL